MSIESVVEIASLRSRPRSGRNADSDCATVAAYKRRGAGIHAEVTMYQPNDDVRPTGAEVSEFDDAPPTPESEDEDDDAEPAVQRSVHEPPPEE